MSNFDNPTSEERALAAICHLVSLVATSVLCNLLVPVAILCISPSPYVKKQAIEALNFQISVVFWALISFALCFVFIGIPMLIVLAIAAIILPIIATVSVSGGADYRYPLTFRLIKGPKAAA